MDFGSLPPEINSGLMYTGPGSAPMTAAANAWNHLAAELSSTAAQYDSAITNLTGDQWMGPAADSMTAAIKPYVAWMNLTAGQLQHAASQAAASAAAFEAAFAMTVPPPAIEANRAQLAALVATNFLGLNTPGIMATEALYGEMWAQDAAAMYGYAAASASAADLTPPAAPAPVATPGATGLQAAWVAKAAASISELPNTVAGLANPIGSVTASDIINSIDGLLGTPFVSIGIDGLVSAAAWWSMNTIPNSVLAGHTLGVDAPPAPAGLPEAGASEVGETVLTGIRAGSPPTVSAGLGAASTAGGLSVPANWSAAASATQSNAAAGGSGWAAAPEEGSAAVLPAGMPSVASASRGGIGAPRYGIKPTVMPKTGLV